MQADILDRRPDNGETTRLCREGVNLIGALAYIAEQSLNRIGRLNVSVHRSRERIKREGVLFILGQTSHRLGIALAVFGECSRPVGSTPPVLSVAPRCQRVRLGRRRALVWG